MSKFMTKQEKVMKTDIGIFNIITKVFLIAMVGIYPLFYKTSLAYALISKKQYFEIVAISFISLGLLCGLIKLIKNKNRVSFKNMKQQISVTDICAGVLIITLCISCLISPGGIEAFKGTQGRMLGGMVFLLCVGVYFGCSRGFQSFKILLWAFLLANVFYWIIIIFHFWKIDFMNLYFRINPAKHYIFMGTLGNINVNAGYSCVILAILTALYFLSKEKFSQRLYLLAIGIGIYACFALRSDSWILGFGSAVLLLLWFALKSKEKMLQFLKLWLVFLTASFFMFLTIVITDKFQITTNYVPYLKPQKLPMLLLNPLLLLLQAVLLIAAYLFIFKYYRETFRKIGRVLLIGVIILLAAAFVYMLFTQRGQFGSNRGSFWKATLLSYRDLPLQHKLFGYGPNCFPEFINAGSGKPIQDAMHVRFLDAHNEPLQFLAITGIFGMLSYMGMQLTLFIRCFRHHANNPALLVGVLGIGAYMAQGFVNNPSIFYTPLLFVLLGITDAMLRKKTVNP